MRYTVRCPHCGQVRSFQDYQLWPEAGPAKYPGPSEPQKCLNGDGWMRIVLVGQDRELTVEKCDGP